MHLCFSTSLQNPVSLDTGFIYQRFSHDLPQEMGNHLHQKWTHSYRYIEGRTEALMQLFTLIAFKSQDKSLSTASRNLNHLERGGQIFLEEAESFDDICLFTIIILVLYN